MSFNRLPASMQGFLAQLCVFRGGWTLAAAETVCGADALECLSQLHEQSLVVVDEMSGEQRYRLLESIREFGRERLVESGLVAEFRERHAGYYLSLAESAGQHLAGSEQSRWLACLDSDLGNLRTAMEWSLERPNAAPGLRLGGALCKYWEIRGLLREGRAFLSQILDVRDETVMPASRAAALNGAGALAYRQGDYAAAKELIEKSVELYRPSSDRCGQAHSHNNLGLVVQEIGRIDEAREHYETSLAIERDIGNLAGVARSLNNLGNIAADRGDLLDAKALYEEALQLHRDRGDQVQQSGVLNNLGTVVADLGDLEAAYGLFESALAINRELGDRWGVGNSLGNLGIVAVARGETSIARDAYEEALVINREVGNRAGEARNLHNLGGIAIVQSQFNEARRLLNDSLALQRTLGDRHNMANTLRELGRIALRTGDRNAAIRYQMESLTVSSELGDKLGIARSLANLGFVAEAAGDQARAVRLLAAHDGLRTEIGAPVTPREDDDYNESMRRLRGDLTESAFRAAYAEGLAMTHIQAVDHALNEIESRPEDLLQSHAGPTKYPRLESDQRPTA